MKSPKPPKVQIQVSTDKHTLWVNSATGMNIARFSSKGIDIHHDNKGQRDGKHCLFCLDGRDPMNPVPFEDDWELFKKKLFEHHGITIGKHIKMHLRTQYVSKVFLHRSFTPIEHLHVNLEQWEDRETEETAPVLMVRPHTEPETFEIRCDGGRQVLNKGDLVLLAKGLLDMAGHEAQVRKVRP